MDDRNIAKRRGEENNAKPENSKSDRLESQASRIQSLSQIPKHLKPRQLRECRPGRMRFYEHDMKLIRNIQRRT
jgi:hypothetical protein